MSTFRAEPRVAAVGGLRIRGAGALGTPSPTFVLQLRPRLPRGSPHIFPHRFRRASGSAGMARKSLLGTVNTIRRCQELGTAGPIPDQRLEFPRASPPARGLLSSSRAPARPCVSGPGQRGHAKPEWPLPTPSRVCSPAGDCGRVGTTPKLSPHHLFKAKI